jgi:hypothetical protein
MSIIIRRNIPMALTLVVAVYMIYDQIFAVGKGMTAEISRELTAIVAVISTFMLFVGSFNMIYGEFRFFQKETGLRRYFRLYELAWMFGTMALGFYLGTGNEIYTHLQLYVSTNGEATAYSMLFLAYIAGLWRTYRIRSTESLAMVGAGFLMIMANTPLLQAILGSPLITLQWFLLQVVVKAMTRGIQIGAAVGATLLIFRTIAGKETGYLGALGAEAEAG